MLIYSTVVTVIAIVAIWFAWRFCRADIRLYIYAGTYAELAKVKQHEYSAEEWRQARATVIANRDEDVPNEIDKLIKKNQPFYKVTAD